jgi:acetamidase/formamidase
MATHELHSSPQTCHWGYFDSKLKPALRIRSGDIATIHCVSGSPEILPADPFHVLPEHREVLAALSPHLGRHILTGPVHVEGAERGDALAVEVLDIKFRTNWGWNVQRPNAGTLPEDFPFYRLTHIPIDSNRGVCTLPWGLEVELRPFFGVMGVAPPPEWGQCSSIEPRAFGGNIDNKHFQVGTTVYLPVFAPGALFSTGDGHGVQGDGEVNLTALETSLSGTFRFTVRKDMKLVMPRAETATHWITHGFDSDLDDAAKEALRDMIRLISAKTGLPAADAYMLCSLQADLHISQTVDGNKGVHCMIAKKLLQ